MTDNAEVCASKAGLEVPSIIGSTSTEGNLFILGAVGSQIESLYESDYGHFLAVNFRQVSAEINSAYPASKFTSVFEAMPLIVTDYGFRCPSYRALLSGAPGEKGPNSMHEVNRDQL